MHKQETRPTRLTCVCKCKDKKTAVTTAVAAEVMRHHWSHIRPAATLARSTLILPVRCRAPRILLLPGPVLVPRTLLWVSSTVAYRWGACGGHTRGRGGGVCVGGGSGPATACGPRVPSSAAWRRGAQGAKCGVAAGGAVRGGSPYAVNDAR